MSEKAWWDSLLGGQPDVGLDVPDRVWAGAIDRAFDPDLDVSDGLVDTASPDGDPVLDDDLLVEVDDFDDLDDLDYPDSDEPDGDDAGDPDYDDIGFDG